MLGIAKTKPPDFVRISIAIYRARLQDHDNRIFSVKPIVDAIVKAGWLVDDDPSHCSLEVLEFVEKDRRQRRTEVRLEW